MNHPIKTPVTKYNITQQMVGTLLPMRFGRVKKKSVLFRGAAAKLTISLQRVYSTCQQMLIAIDSYTTAT